MGEFNLNPPCASFDEHSVCVHVYVCACSCMCVHVCANVCVQQAYC